MKMILTRLKVNSFWLLISRIGTQGMMVLVTILLARRLGSAGFGEYVFIAAVLMIGNMLTTFGTDMYLMREIAAHDDLSGLPAALMVQLVLSIVFVGVVSGAARLLPNQSSGSLLALRIYILALFPLAFTSVFSSALRGKELMGTYAMLSLANALIQVAAIRYLPVEHLPTLALLLLVIQTLVALLAGIWCSVKIPGFWKGWHFSIRAVWQLLRKSAPIALLAVMGAVYQKLSITMLSGLTSAVLTGWFAAALKAVEASKTVHAAAFTALYPIMARTDRVILDDSATLRFLLYLLLGGAAAAAFIVCLLAQPLVMLLFGTEYAPAIPVLRILAWNLIPYTINTFFSLAFLAAGQEYRVVLVLSVSLVALIIFNSLMIPWMGLVGAAVAALVVECIQAFLFLLQRQAVSLRFFNSE